MKEAECFYCIRVFRNPDGTRSPSLWNGFSKGSNSLALNTKAKQRSCLYLVFPFFCFLTLLKTDLLVSVMEDVSVIFTSAAFQWETVALCIALLYYNFEWWQKLRRDKSCRFRPPKEATKKFLCSNFWSPKVQYKEKWAVDVFRNWQAAREKSHTLYSSREACSKCEKTWKKGSRTCIASP